MSTIEATRSVPLFAIEKGKRPLILLSVHEGRHIPDQLHDAEGRPLGIHDPCDLERHIAYDLGAGELTTLLGGLTKAHVFRATHSRLVADINRFADEPECIVPRADGTDIPLNRSMSKAERALRLQRYHGPAIKAVQRLVADVASQAGEEPFVVSVHTFARVLREDPTRKDEDICVFGYPEFGPSPKLERFVTCLRSDHPSLVVGNNQPFSARTPNLNTAEDDHRMACPVTYYGVVERGNVDNHFSVEVCQDLLSTDSDRRRMAAKLHAALSDVLGCL